MGEIADMILDGILDEWTGEYIGPAVGYPRSLDPEHWSNQSNKTKRKKTDNPYVGISNWIDSQWLSGSGKNEQHETRA